MHERAISLFSQCGDDEKAVEAARQGVIAYPRGSYMWLLLGRALREHSEFAAPGEVEACVRRSLQLNCSLFESADWLAMLLTEQRRYEEAERVIATVESMQADPSPAQGRKAWIKREAGAKREAIADLSDVLRKFPGYGWGWKVLLGWLEEDKDWTEIKSLLGPVPPQMLSDVSFRLRRLQLLEKAKAEKGPLDAEWKELLDDYPEDVPLHLHRFDSLREAGRWDEAAATLERIAPVAGEDVYLMARLVDIKCHEGNFDVALQYAMKVCFAPVEQSNWPVNRVWEVLGSTEHHGKLAERFRARLEEGARPTARALARFLEYVVDQEQADGLLRVIRQTRLNPATRKIIRLMKIIERSSWRDEFSCEDLFAILNAHGYSRLVVRFWSHMRDQGAGGDSAAWGQAGRAMVNLSQKAKARELLRDWRNRRGVEMWSLANYLHCLSRFRKHDLEEVIATCKDALTDLRHDHCARYLANMQAEAYALTGDKSGLLALWNDRRGYFEGDLKPGEYFRASCRYLLTEIPDLVEALQRNDRKSYRKSLRRIRFHRLWNKENRARAWKIARFLLQLLALLWFIGTVSGVFRM
jgi:tetratricopeptide (TPR) repeat protein